MISARKQCQRLMGVLALSAIAAVTLPVHAQEEAKDQGKPITYVKGDQIRIKLPEVPANLINPWPAAEQEAFWKRAQPLMALYKGKADARVYDEAEKWAYPTSMMAYYANHGNREVQLKHIAALSKDEGGADHKATFGVDLYWSFTLKSQPRKYFQFGPELSEAYKENMRKAMKVWTADDVKPGFETILLFDSPDPELHDYAAKTMEKMTGEKFGKDREKWDAYWAQYSNQGWRVFEDYERLKNVRPHPVHGIGKGPVGGAWNPAVRGFWADARNTDNLRGMRESAAYLFAEESGNELTRKIYKEKIRRTAYDFYGIGMGEWDSSTYLAHSLNPYLGVYDFAKDPEVRGYAKAILDYLSTTAAMKYFHGSWGAPIKRDYGTHSPWKSAPKSFYAYFGSTPTPPKDIEHDWASILASSYRPPMAVVKLAQKNFDEPVEFINSHPSYDNWLPGAGEKPEFHSTIYFNKNYHLGTAARGSRGDMSGMKLMIRDKNGLGSYIIFAAGDGKKRTKNISVANYGADRIAQYKNMMIFLSKNKTSDPYQMSMPNVFVKEIVEGVIFVNADHTFVAIHPLAIESKGDRPKKKRKGKGTYEITMHDFVGKGGKAVGYVMEVGEKREHGSYEDFKKAILSKGKVDADLDNLKVKYTGTNGKTVAIDASPAGLPKVWRNGKEHDFTQHVDVFKPADGSNKPASLKRNQFKMYVEAGGYTFEAELKPNGEYVSKSTGPGIE